MEITRSRPVGISIIAVLLGIQGALEVVYGLLALMKAPGYVISYSSVSMVVVVSPWALIVSGILALLLTYGLWTLRGWAFWTVVVIELLNLIGGTIALFSYYYPGAVLVAMVIPSVILIYFFVDRNVLSAFNIGSS